MAALAKTLTYDEVLYLANIQILITMKIGKGIIAEITNKTRLLLYVYLFIQTLIIFVSARPLLLTVAIVSSRPGKAS